MTDQELEVHVRLALIDFIGAITGLRPPINKDAVPPELRPHFDAFVQKIMTAISPSEAKTAQIARIIQQGRYD